MVDEGSCVTDGSHVTDGSCVTDGPHAIDGSQLCGASGSRCRGQRKDLQVEVNIPFCDNRKCLYCRRNVYMTQRTLVEAYLEALIREIEAAGPELGDFSLRTVHITGGCPTTLGSSGLKRLFIALRTSLPGFKDASVTFDMAPGQMSRSIMTQLRNNHVEHIMVNVATASQAEHDLLGRPYEMEPALRDVALCISGYQIERGLSFGIMVGIPGQTKGTLCHTLNRVLIYAPDEIMIEPVEADGLSTDRQPALSDGDRLELLGFVRDKLADNGYEAYTPHRYSREGRLNEAPLLRSAGTESMGFGLSAFTWLDGVLCRNTGNLTEYIEGSPDPAALVSRMSRLDGDACSLIAASMGLESLQGIPADVDCGVVTIWLEPLLRGGFLERRDGRIVMSDLGILHPSKLLSVDLLEKLLA